MHQQFGRNKLKSFSRQPVSMTTLLAGTAHGSAQDNCSSSSQMLLEDHCPETDQQDAADGLCPATCKVAGQTSHHPTHRHHAKGAKPIAPATGRMFTSKKAKTTPTAPLPLPLPIRVPTRWNPRGT